MFLEDEQWASHLDLADPTAAGPSLADLKHHVAHELLELHGRGVTYALLGTVALAVLNRFAQGDGRFVLWLVGRSGTGKSFTARRVPALLRPLPEEGVANWTSTPNFIEERGFYYENALYLVDDFKPENCRRDHVVRVIQAYADMTSRGRLRSDATPNPSHMIRGQMVVTGEDLVEHSASMMARTVVVPVEEGAPRIVHGRRCRELQDQLPRMRPISWPG